MAAQGPGARGRRGRSGFTEINITPLTDVFLVLVIILLITAPLIQNTSIKVELPSSASGDKADQTKPLSLAVDKKGQFSVNGTIVPEAKLVETLTREAKTSKQTVLLLQADSEATQKFVVKAMDAARQAGLRKISFATQPSAS
ncbi:MAG: biopolymer transporter ExbD [Anaerolineae bacterium]|nr:biopolymer transporter ExbD [Gloeobacterales cyanobacterium ES-bin-313]